MGGNNSFQESVSADKTSIGFEYQFYYFVYKLLDLNKGESIGYEVKDDVHLEFSNGEFILIQLKHSMKEKSDGSISNLTTKDIDLWKTMHNWINMIKEIDNGLYNEEKLRLYTFILVSNKGNSLNNTLLSDIKKFKLDELSVEGIKANIHKLMQSTNKEEKLYKYMTTLYILDNDILKIFLTRIKFDLDFDNIIEKIKDKIESQAYIDRTRVEDVLNELVGNLSIWKFDKVKAKGRILINYEDAYKKIKPCYEKVRRESIPNREVQVSLPSNLMEQEFIKELIDIGEITVSDKKEAAKFTKYMLQVERLLEEMYQEGIITKNEITKLENEAIAIWENIHKKSYIKIKRKISTLKVDDKIDILNECALECLYGIRDKILKIQQEELDTIFSNGKFYYLSENKFIGWKIEWEMKYK